MLVKTIQHYIDTNDVVTHIPTFEQPWWDGHPITGDDDHHERAYHTFERPATYLTLDGTDIDPADDALEQVRQESYDREVARMVEDPTTTLLDAVDYAHRMGDVTFVEGYGVVTLATS